jgi:hypothetical protein
VEEGENVARMAGGKEGDDRRWEIGDVQDGGGEIEKADIGEREGDFAAVKIGNKVGEPVEEMSDVWDGKVNWRLMGVMESCRDMTGEKVERMKEETRMVMLSKIRRKSDQRGNPMREEKSIAMSDDRKPYFFWVYRRYCSENAFMC